MKRLMVVIWFCLLAVVAVHAQDRFIVNHTAGFAGANGDFWTTAGWNAQQMPQKMGANIHLVPNGAKDFAGAVNSGVPLPIKGGFTAMYLFYFNQVSGSEFDADGAAVGIHNDPRGERAVGGIGGNWGAGSIDSNRRIRNSVFWGMDVFADFPRQNISAVGMFFDGEHPPDAMDGRYVRLQKIRFASGHPIAVQLRYNDLSKKVDLLFDDLWTGEWEGFQYQVDLVQRVGSSGYFFVSASTGGFTVNPLWSGFTYGPYASGMMKMCEASDAEARHQLYKSIGWMSEHPPKI